MLGEGVDELLFGEVAELDEVGADAAALILLKPEGLVELGLVDPAVADQQLSQLVGNLGLRPADRFRG